MSAEPNREGERAMSEYQDVADALAKMTPGKCLAFFATVIKSGESWSPECDKAYREAKDYLSAATARIAELEAERDTVLKREAATIYRHDARIEKLEAERDAIRKERDALLDIAERCVDAWDGLSQTEMAASEIGVASANSFRSEGYGLMLRIAINEARAALAATNGGE